MAARRVGGQAGVGMRKDGQARAQVAPAGTKAERALPQMGAAAAKAAVALEDIVWSEGEVWRRGGCG